jgi:hypothetical protein
VGELPQPRPARTTSPPFMDPPGPGQRSARGVGSQVQILKVLVRFTMAKFKNRLTAEIRGALRHAGPSGPGLQTLAPAGLPLPSGCLLAAFRLLPPYKYPPAPLPEVARGVGAGVQILKLLPRFSMAKFKNRLTATRRTQAGPPNPPGAGGVPCVRRQAGRAPGGPIQPRPEPRRRSPAALPTRPSPHLVLPAPALTSSYPRQRPPPAPPPTRPGPHPLLPAATTAPYPVGYPSRRRRRRPLPPRAPTSHLALTT